MCRDPWLHNKSTDQENASRIISNRQICFSLIAKTAGRQQRHLICFFVEETVPSGIWCSCSYWKIKNMQSHNTSSGMKFEQRWIDVSLTLYWQQCKLHICIQGVKSHEMSDYNFAAAVLLFWWLGSCRVKIKMSGCHAACFFSQG